MIDRLKIYEKIQSEMPRASLNYARIVEILIQRGSAAQSDLCIEIADDVNSASVPQALKNMERIGLVRIDRGINRSDGNTVKLISVGSGK